MLTEYLKPETRDWDRGETVGASEIGQCARRTAYTKNEAPIDPGYEDAWGMKERGHWVEKWVVSRMKANGAPVHETGDEQVTRSDGFASATADGWLEREGAGNISFDVKSFDPRKSKLPEESHIVQARLGAKLNPKTTSAMIIYVNASDFEDQQEFGPYPELDDDELASAKERARDIMSKSPDELPREGFFVDECNRFNCPYRQVCIGKELTVEGPLPQQALEQLKEIQARHAKAKAEKDDAEKRCKMAQEEVRTLFRANKTRIAKGLASISRQTRSSLDTEAMERDGINVDAYRRDGNPFDVITIRKPKG